MCQTRRYKTLDAVYGESSPSISTVKHWSKLFRWGREYFEDDLCHKTVTMLENVALVEKVVLSDHRLKTKETALQTGLSKNSSIFILNDQVI